MSTSPKAAQKNKFLLALAWIFAVLFVVSTIGVVLTFFPIGKLLSADFYQQALEDVHIYQRLPETIAKQLAINLTPNPQDSDSQISLLVLNEQEWESILIELIDPVWLQSQSEEVLEQFFDILLHAPDPVHTPVEISVAEVKMSLTGPDGIQAFNQVLDAQPPCSINQLMGLVQIGLGMENTTGSILCRPPDYILSELSPLVQSFLSSAVSQLPDQVQFYLPLAIIDSQIAGTASNTNLGEIPESIRILRQANSAISWSPLLPMIMMLLVTVFAVRSLRDFMLWWGGTLLAAGLISLVLAVIMVPTANWALDSFIPLDLSSYLSMPELLVQIGFADLSSELVNGLVMSMVIPAGVITTIGLALLLGVFLLSRSPGSTSAQHIHPTTPTETYR